MADKMKQTKMPPGVGGIFVCLHFNGIHDPDILVIDF